MSGSFVVPERVRKYNRDVGLLERAKRYEKIATRADELNDTAKADTYFMQFGRAIADARLTKKLTIVWEPEDPSEGAL